MTAGTVGLLCCCPTTDCNCVSLSSVLVTWSGSITYDADCIPGTCNSGSDYSMPAKTYSNLAIVADRVEGSGFCLYEGTYTDTVTLTNCDDPGVTIDVTFEAYASVSYSAGNWHAFFNFRMAGCAGTCNWHTGGFSNADMEKTSDQVSAAGDCPALETYTNATACDPSVAANACSNGCPAITAYTAGTLTVS